MFVAIYLDKDYCVLVLLWSVTASDKDALLLELKSIDLRGGTAGESGKQRKRVNYFSPLAHY